MILRLKEIESRTYRNVLTLFLLILSCSIAFAGPIGASKAREIAQACLKGKTLTTTESVKKIGAKFGVSSPAYYVFNASNDEGFVLVSGDDEVGPILGYSDNGTFNSANVHPALQAYLDFCEQYINDVEAGNVEAPMRASETPGTIIVDALCKSQWGQGTPFNNFCPKFGSTYSPCGCIATAMAQIMRRWEWPESGRGNIAYNCEGYGVLTKDLSTSTYDWSLMKDKGGTIRDQYVRKAMATICYDAGLSVNMTYTATESGATDIKARVSLPRYFKYKASTAELKFRECYSSNYAWMKMLKNELNAGRPVIYCATDTTYGGHAFVVDGYDSNGFVHVNWGWDGTSNGYYNLTNLQPDNSVYKFTTQQSMIIGIEPDSTEEDTKFSQFKLYMAERPECNGTQIVGLPFFVTYKKAYNMDYDNHIFTLGVGLYNADGEFIKEISTSSLLMTHSYTQQFKPGYGFTEFNVAAKIDKSVEDGGYALRCIIHEQDYTDWILPDMVGGSEFNWIPIVVKNNKVYLNSSDGPQAPTAIDEITIDSPSIYNFFYYIKENAQSSAKGTYNLSGQKLTSPMKGLNIINGKKVFVK